LFNFYSSDVIFIWWLLFLAQELSGQLVTVVSVLSVVVGGFLHNNLYAVSGACLIILASPFDR
jgi:hypothetical protein